MTRQDANAMRIVSALRAAGATARFIEFAHGMAGCPDVLVGWKGNTFLMELKVKGGRLSDAQKKFHAEWQGVPILVIRSEVEALEAIGLAAGERAVG